MHEDRQQNAFAALDILARADSAAFAAGRSDAAPTPLYWDVYVVRRSSDQQESITVRAPDENAAREQVKRLMGRDFNRILRVEKRHAFYSDSAERNDAAERQVTAAEAQTLRAAQLAVWSTGEGAYKKWWTRAAPVRSDAMETESSLNAKIHALKVRRNNGEDTDDVRREIARLEKLHDAMTLL